MTATGAQAELTDGVLQITGTVDLTSVVELRYQGERRIREAGKDLVVDLSGLGTAHSAVLSMLLCWQRLAASLGVALSFRGMNDRLASLAALSNLDGQLTRAH